jgi:hypothetical protein
MGTHFLITQIIAIDTELKIWLIFADALIYSWTRVNFGECINIES